MSIILMILLVTIITHVRIIFTRKLWILKINKLINSAFKANKP